MANKNVKLEFVNDDVRRTMIDQRLQGVEQEVLNAQIDLAIEEGVASTFKAENRPQDGYPGSRANVAQRQLALDNAIARLEALRALRDGNTTTRQAKD